MIFKSELKHLIKLKPVGFYGWEHFRFMSTYLICVLFRKPIWNVLLTKPFMNKTYFVYSRVKRFVLGKLYRIDCNHSTFFSEINPDMCDRHLVSPNYIDKLSSKQVMRIMIMIINVLLSWCITKFQNQMRSDREGESSISIRSYVSRGGAWGRGRQIPFHVSVEFINHTFVFFESQSVVHNSLGSWRFSSPVF